MDVQDYIITKIVGPELNQSNYAQGISDTFDNIDENFSKLASLPYIQGPDGHKFKVQSTLLVDGDNLTDLGKEAVKAILHKENEDGFNNEIAECSTLTAVNEVISAYSIVVPEYQPVSGKNILDTLEKNNKVWMYVTCDDLGNEDSQWVCQYYRFLDGRLEGLSDDVVSTGFEFRDLSCFLIHHPSEEFVEDSTNIGVFERVYLTPTIYYDSESGDWCWAIGETTTGISAKGIQGGTGTPAAKTWIVKVEPATMLGDNFKNCQVTDVLQYENSEWSWKSVSDVSSQIMDGDVCYCFNPQEEESSDVDIDLFISTVVKDQNAVNVGYGKANSMFSYMNKYDLNYLLSRVGLTDTQNNTANTVRGLWIYAKPNSTGAEHDNSVHMLYADADGRLHVGYCKDRDGVVENTNDLLVDNYNIKIKESLTVERDTDLNSNLTVKGSTQIGKCESGEDGELIYSQHNIKGNVQLTGEDCRLTVDTLSVVDAADNSLIETGQTSYEYYDPSTINWVSTGNLPSVSVPNLNSSHIKYDYGQVGSLMIGDFCLISPDFPTDANNIKSALTNIFGNQKKQTAILRTKNSYSVGYSKVIVESKDCEETINGHCKVAINTGDYSMGDVVRNYTLNGNYGSVGSINTDEGGVWNHCKYYFLGSQATYDGPVGDKVYMFPYIDPNSTTNKTIIYNQINSSYGNWLKSVNNLDDYVKTKLLINNLSGINISDVLQVQFEVVVKLKWVGSSGQVDVNIYNPNSSWSYTWRYGDMLDKNGTPLNGKGVAWREPSDYIKKGATTQFSKLNETTHVRSFDYSCKPVTMSWTRNTNGSWTKNSLPQPELAGLIAQSSKVSLDLQTGIKIAGTTATYPKTTNNDVVWNAPHSTTYSMELEMQNIRVTYTTSGNSYAITPQGIYKWDGKAATKISDSIWANV